MTTLSIQTWIELDVIECYLCGVQFGMTKEMNGYRLKDHNSFYCPNGHRQNYVGETQEQKLTKQLEEEKRKLANAQFEMMMNEKKVKRLEKRIKNGICPCCHRQFIQLTRHMKTKHPEYGDSK